MRALCCWLVAGVCGTGAQAQARPETIRGRITSETGTPIVGATVSVTIAPGRSFAEARSDSAGVYLIRISEGHGDYLLHASKLGLSPFRKRITGAAIDAVYVADIVMKPAAQPLSAVRVTAQKPKPSRTPDPGTETGASEKIADSFNGSLLPDAVGDINAIAGTLPGLTPTTAGLSFIGLDPSQNSITLNGMAFPSSSFPRAAQTTLRVSTTTYDPARGWFGGANSNLEFRSGGIFSSRQAFATIDAPPLQFSDRISANVGQRYTNVNVSVGGAGPIDSRDKYFYSFAIQGGRKLAVTASLLTADSALLRSAGIQPDSVAVLVAIMQRTGIPTTAAGIPTELVTENASIIARFDRSPFNWQALAPSRTTTALTVFGNWSRAMPLALGAKATPARTAGVQDASASAQGLYSAYFGSDFLSTTRTSVSLSTQRTDSYLMLPSASVDLRSNFADGSTGLASLEFGGAGASPGQLDRWTWETSSDIQFYSEAKRSLHRVTLAIDGRFDGFGTGGGENLGRFTFNSLRDLAANIPSTFSRTVNIQSQQGAEWNGFAALGDLWRVTPNFQIQYGARFESNAFTRNPVRNPLVEDVFGYRTDVAPGGSHISPRVGFTWVRRGGGNNGAVAFNPMGRFNLGPTAYIRGGVGEFRSLTPVALIADPLVRTGLPGAPHSILCVGASVPQPDWSGYRNGGSAIPATCLSPSIPTNDIKAAPDVALMAPNFSPPRSWRANLSYASQVHRVSYSADATYSINLDQQSRTDLNLRPDPAFTLADEGRAVFSPISAIVPRSGAVSRIESRVDSRFDQVIAVGSAGRSVGRQLIVSASPDLSGVSHWFASVSYVLSDARTRGDGFTTNVAGSPFNPAWSRSALDARHQAVFRGGYSASGLTLTMFARTSSGLPFTPLVGGDVNGDGFLNDRAFVFDQFTTRDTSLARSMVNLLSTLPPKIRACLEKQSGRIAGPQSCESRPTTSMSMALTVQPQLLHLSNRISQVQLAFANPLAGVDYLAHGSNHLRGWGLQPMPDPILLDVEGFDPVARAFKYGVNPRFGSTDPSRTTLRAPFRITLDVSLSLGRDVALQQLERYLRPGRGGHAGERLGVAELKRRYERSVPDPYAEILQESDSLLLTREQTAVVQNVQSVYRHAMDSVWTALATDFAGLGDEFDVSEAVKRQEATIDAGWELSRVDVRKRLPDILSPVQLVVLPGTAGRLFKAPGPVRKNGRTMYP
jgi:hypothetical protein